MLKQQILWRCHRGMRELDLFLIPFCQACVETMPIELQALFEDLLEEEDPMLFSWCMGQSEPPAHYQMLIELIRSFKRDELPF